MWTSLLYPVEKTKESSGSGFVQSDSEKSQAANL